MTRTEVGAPPRAWLLRGFLLLLTLSTLNALRLLFTRWPDVAAAFPGGGAALRPLSIALACGLLASYWGLWRWRRWAVASALVLSLLTIGADIAWRGPRVHLAAAIASSALLGLLLYRHRGEFARARPPR